MPQQLMAPTNHVRSNEAYNWSFADNKCYRFNPETSGIVKWKSLKVWTKEKKTTDHLVLPATDKHLPKI